MRKSIIYRRRSRLKLAGLLAMTAVVSMAVYAGAAEFNSAAAFARGNAAYASGDYDKALAEYGAIVDHGITGGNLYYNIGNCRLKKGELGEAIINYERAGLFIPRDSDLAANYELARSMMKQKDPNPGKNWFVRGLDYLFAYLSPDEVFKLLAALFYLAAILAIIAIFKNSTRPFLNPAIAMLLLIFLLALIPAHGKIQRLERGGVVAAKITGARFEPLERSDSSFPLYDGMKVQVLSAMGDWFKIMRLDGKIGWVEKKSVRLLVKNN